MADDTQTVTATPQPTEAQQSPIDDGNKTWWYEYDATTSKYTRAIFSSTQPENTTADDPQGLYEPVFDKTAGKWTGETVDDFMSKMKAQADAVVDPDKQQTSQMLQMIVALKAEVSTLKAQSATIATTTAQTDVSQTASQTTSQLASESTTQSASQSTSAVTGGATNA
ncbi:unnamed protein product [Fructobacillus evanidus]|uniref:Uncharacterized protein n=1 Tax=Fructobacillus evanidus TaxID=3064281 RepID=A0ABN9YZ77_9LACO|nr:unnamed protein product [Fructobacillus sp. LMG 32999]